MYHKLLFASIAALILSCNKESGNHLPPEKMKAVLTDIHLAESYSMVLKNNTLSQPSSKNIDSLSEYYAVILKHHGITSQEYQSSLEWYKEHPQDLDTIYTNMQPEFSRLQGEYGGEK